MVPSETRTATARCLAAGKIVVVVEMSRMWESSSRPPFARWTRPDADPCEVRVRQFDFVVWNTKTTASRKHQQTQEASENVWTRHNAEVCGRASFEKVQCPWAAILFLTQLCLGERAEAATSVRVSWVHNLQQEHGNPCYIEIPDGVNEKTKARTVPMLQCFANLLRGWMYASPLVTPDGGQWPFPEQPLQDPQCCLFPGLQVNGNKLTRTWTRPISTRAYLKKIREAADILHRERADMQSRGLPSVWDETDLAKLGTHSMKRTCVSLLKDKCRSSAVVGAICGTTPATLDREYDAPTQRRQRMALQDALGPVLDVSAASVFCTGCRTERQSPKWIYCPACGTKFA